ncbi:MAG TPA: anti-sigma factor [Solirubrobacteraceae bacterium]|nr:anti-sigma factor [Solirubrobacteraceae bacterium]
MGTFEDRARFARDHQWAPEHMSEYLDRELGASALDRMARHLGECEECRRLLSGLRAVVDGLGRLPAPAGGIGVTAIAASVRVRLHNPEG